MKTRLGIIAAVAFVFGSAAFAIGIPQIEYLTKGDFLSLAFKQQPKWKMLRLKGDLKKDVEGILSHPYPSKRLRYWPQGDRTAWVIEEIGKEYPITFGIVIDSGKIERIEVMVYREERGGEIHQEFFRKQFEGLTLTGNGLSGEIDGITGATLSVEASMRVAELALYLHQYVQTKKT